MKNRRLNVLNIEAFAICKREIQQSRPLKFFLFSAVRVKVNVQMLLQINKLKPVVGNQQHLLKVCGKYVATVPRMYYVTYVSLHTLYIIARSIFCISKTYSCIRKCMGALEVNGPCFFKIRPDPVRVSF